MHFSLSDKLEILNEFFDFPAGYPGSYIQDGQYVVRVGMPNDDIMSAQLANKLNYSAEYLARIAGSSERPKFELYRTYEYTADGKYPIYQASLQIPEEVMERMENVVFAMLFNKIANEVSLGTLSDAGGGIDRMDSAYTQRHGIKKLPIVYKSPDSRLTYDGSGIASHLDNAVGKFIRDGNLLPFHIDYEEVDGKPSFVLLPHMQMSFLHAESIEDSEGVVVGTPSQETVYYNPANSVARFVRTALAERGFNGKVVSYNDTTPPRIIFDSRKALEDFCRNMIMGSGMEK